MSRELKIQAAAAALEWVEDGMVLGIGTGSTAEEFVRLLAEQVAEGLSITGVPTSERTAALCRELSVPLGEFDDYPRIDLVVDGADEVDPSLNLIKGAGGALLREKIVAHAADRMAVIVDESKLVNALGKFPLPIEVNPFGLTATRIAIDKVAEAQGLSGVIELRRENGKPFVTDGGHLILDASFGHISDAQGLSTALLRIPGVVEHGLFLGYATVAFSAGAQGTITLTAS